MARSLLIRKVNKNINDKDVCDIGLANFSKKHKKQSLQKTKLLKGFKKSFFQNLSGLIILETTPSHPIPTIATAP